MSSMKKAAFAALVLSATSVFAASPLYYGAGFGIGQNNSKFTSTASNAGVAETTGTGSITTGGTSGQIFGFVGYELGLSDSIKTSIQADIGYDSLNATVYEVITSATNTSTLNIKSGFDYGVSGRLGMVHGDYAPYLIAGVRVGQWSATVDNTSTVAQSTDFIRSGINATTVKKTVVAPELGLGVQFTLSDSIDGRMEYKYAFGGSFSGVDTTSTTGYQNTYKLSPRQQSVQLSFIF